MFGIISGEIETISEKTWGQFNFWEIKLKAKCAGKEISIPCSCWNESAHSLKPGHSIIANVTLKYKEGLRKDGSVFESSTINLSRVGRMPGDGFVDVNYFNVGMLVDEVIDVSDNIKALKGTYQGYENKQLNIKLYIRSSNNFDIAAGSQIDAVGVIAANSRFVIKHYDIKQGFNEMPETNQETDGNQQTNETDKKETDFANDDIDQDIPF